MLNLEVVSTGNTKQGDAFHCTITFDLTCQGLRRNQPPSNGVVMTSRTAISSKHGIIQPALKALDSEKSCQGKYLSSPANVAMQSWAEKKKKKVVACNLSTWKKT